MTETISYEAAYIVKTPGIVGGKARVNGSRIPVWTLVAHYLNGASPEALANDFEISLAQVHGGLAYYYEHKTEIDDDIRTQMKQAREMKEQGIGKRHSLLP